MEEIATNHVDIVEEMLLVTVSLVTAPMDVRTIGRVTCATVWMEQFYTNSYHKLFDLELPLFLIT